MKKCLVFVSLVLFGCATTQTLKTPSGKPEFTFYKVQRKELANAILNRMITKGYSVKQVTDYTIVMRKAETGILTGALFGSRYDSTPERRITFTFVEVDSGIRTIIADQIVTNPGSAFEKITEMDGGKASGQEQDFLQAISDSLTGKK